MPVSHLHSTKDTPNLHSLLFYNKKRKLSKLRYSFHGESLIVSPGSLSQDSLSVETTTTAAAATATTASPPAAVLESSTLFSTSSPSSSSSSSLPQIQFSAYSMPLSYDMFRDPASPNPLSSNDSFLPGLVDKLAKIVLRSRLPPSNAVIPRDELVSPTTFSLWRSGPPLHINIYCISAQVLLERWVISYEHLSTVSLATSSTQSDMILLLQQAYSYTRLMPLHNILASGVLNRVGLGYNITTADSPVGSLDSVHQKMDRIEFSNDAKLKVFRFNHARDTSGMGKVNFEVVFDETCGGLSKHEEKDEEGEAEEEEEEGEKQESNDMKEERQKHVYEPELEHKDKKELNLKRPLNDSDSSIDITSFPLNQTRTFSVNSKLRPHLDHTSDHSASVSPLNLLTPIKSPSSNLSSLFSDGSAKQPPSTPSPLSPTSPLAAHSTPGGFFFTPTSPTSPFHVHHQNSSSSTIAMRRLSRLSLSAMQQEDDDADSNSESENDYGSSPSSSFAMKREGGGTIYYTSRRPPSWSGSSPSLPHPDAINIDSNVTDHSPLHRRSTQRASLGNTGTSMPRRNSFGTEMFGSLVGSYEESIMSGRMSTMPSKPFNFICQIGVLGHGDVTPKCPPHVNLTFPAIFYELAEGTGAGTPYVGNIDLEAALRGTNERSKKTSGGYRIPSRGQLQIVIKNPNKTAVKFFLIPYNFDDMPSGTKTFLRQKEYSTDRAPSPIRLSSSSSFKDKDSAQKETLRYALQIQITRTDKGRYYLYKSMRVVFANRVPDGKERLRVLVEGPGEPRYVPVGVKSTKKKRVADDGESEERIGTVGAIGVAGGEYQ